MHEVQLEMKKEHGERLVDSFLFQYNQCRILIYWMRKIFSYLDILYTKIKNIGTLYEIAMKTLDEYLFRPLKDKLFDSVIKMIEDDRDCAVVHRFKIKNLLRAFEEIDMKNADLIKTNEEFLWKGRPTYYILREWFEKFISKTESYISLKASTEIATLSAPEYIKSALKYLDEEDIRKGEYINNIFHEKLNNINHKYLIEQNCKTLAYMDTGIGYMFNNNQDTALKEAFRLISKHSDSLKSMTDEMEAFIIKRGEELYSNKDLAKDPVKFIPELIKLMKEIETQVESAFDNHILFQDSKNNAFSFFMNKEFSSKQLSNFCDF
jgi:hypothetical protein